MGTVGRVVGLFFFMALALGALTSAISLLEVVTASVMDEMQPVAPPGGAVSTGTAITALGVVPALDTDTLGLMDKIAGEFLLVAGGAGAGHARRLAPRRGRCATNCWPAPAPFWQRQVPRILARAALDRAAGGRRSCCCSRCASTVTVVSEYLAPAEARR